jgi:hypothetical protein
MARVGAIRAQETGGRPAHKAVVVGGGSLQPLEPRIRTPLYRGAYAATMG